MCSANRRKWSDKMAIINLAYVCCTVALLFSVNCSAQSTVQPKIDQETITTIIGTTVVLETDNTGDILSTQKPAEPSPAKPTNNVQLPSTAAPPAAVAGTSASPNNSTNVTVAATVALTTQNIVPSQTVNCTETNCTATTSATTAPVNASSPAAVVTVIPTLEAGNETTESVPGVTTAPEGTTANASESAPVQTSKSGETTVNPIGTTQKVTTIKATTKQPTEPVKTDKPTERAATTVNTPAKQTTGVTPKQTTTDQNNVVPKKSSGRKTATAVAITIFVVALITLVGVGYLYRQRQLRLNYGRLNEETEDGGWSAFSKNPIYRGDRDYQPL